MFQKKMEDLAQRAVPRRGDRRLPGMRYRQLFANSAACVGLDP